MLNVSQQDTSLALLYCKRLDISTCYFVEALARLTCLSGIIQTMPNVLSQLPDDVDALKVLLAEQVARNAQIQAEKTAAN